MIHQRYINDTQWSIRHGSNILNDHPWGEAGRQRLSHCSRSCEAERSHFETCEVVGKAKTLSVIGLWQETGHGENWDPTWFFYVAYVSGSGNHKVLLTESTGIFLHLHLQFGITISISLHKKGALTSDSWRFCPSWWCSKRLSALPLVSTGQARVDPWVSKSQIWLPSRRPTWRIFTC